MHSSRAFSIIYRGAVHLEREVALKIISSDGLTINALEQFRIEQKLFGKMQHPNVARILETGYTPEGQPYFAMEYLRGAPITQYCDERHFSIEKRLHLFLDVCVGLHHAHQKGIIHCDIKPSNIIVIEQDGRAVPKIIDFGIARPISQKEIDGIGQASGTLRYISPEQADYSGETPVDIRSDIYSLGPLLYELLTGYSPLDEELVRLNLLVDQWDLVQRTSPLPPSARVVKNDSKSVERASVRGVPPQKLRKKLYGELDWIVMKAMSKDPNERYDSCSAFHQMIQNYMKGFPVLKGSGKQVYIAKKWVRRHLSITLSAATVFIVLITALMVSFSAFNEAMVSKRRLQDIHDFSVGIFEGVNPYKNGPDVKAVELLDQAAQKIKTRYYEQHELEASIRMVLGRSYQELGSWNKARDQYKLATAKYRQSGIRDLEVLKAQYAEAFVLSQSGQLDQAIALYRSGSTEAERRLGKNHPMTLTYPIGLAYAFKQQKRYKEAKRLFEATIQRQKRVVGAEDLLTLRTRTNYATLLLSMGETVDAERIYGEIIGWYRAHSDQIDPFFLILQHGFVRVLYEDGRVDEAEGLAREVIASRRKLLGMDHPETLKTVSNLAMIIGESRSPSEAASLLRENLDLLSEEQRNHSVGLKLRHNLGHFLTLSGAFEEATFVLEDVWRQRIKVLGKDHPGTLNSRYTLGKAWMAKGHLHEAEMILREVTEQASQLYGASHRLTQKYQKKWQELKTSKGTHGKK